MIKKSNNSKRTFAPISISDSLKNVNKKFLYKFGKLDYTIHAKWSDIVGSFFVHHSEPQKISSIANSTNEEGVTLYDRFLHVNVSPAAAVEFQHFQDKIIEKINSYFGYKAIKGIKIHQLLVKTDQDNKKQRNVNLIKEKERKLAVKSSAPKLSNKQLEESIVNLGLSITNEDN
ncbi:DciA family protein [Alphaproteobacteria bacterium]|nr:DciA family protein [Alphaproteobacteria bacterium]